MNVPRILRLFTVAALAAAGTLTFQAPAHAQGMRGSATTTFRYLTLRPVGVDTVDMADVTDTDGLLSFDGQPVTCVSATQCVLYRPRDVAQAMVATQDISGTAWGLGMQGLSATFLIRARADVSGDVTWPGSDNAFDAILAYAQLQRSLYRVRAGRQRTMSGLGFAGFDGLDVLVEPLRGIQVEAYGGRSLARGLYEPRNEALAGIEDFVLDQNAFLVGGLVEVGLLPGTSVSARYQREAWVDQVGLVSERASVDLTSDLPGPFRLDASVDYDFAFDQVGKSHVTLVTRLPDQWGWLEVSGRRYVPYFDLSTIWGFFSPTPYSEGEVRGTLLKFSPLTVWASAGWRAYGDAEIAVIGTPIGDTSQRYGLGGQWTSGPWRASGEYRLETGFGAFLSSGQAQLRWQPSSLLAFNVRGMAFQQIEQFRVGDNAVLGGGAGAEISGPWGLTLLVGADMYSQAFETRTGADWDQIRAYSVLRVPFGSDPGMGGS